MNSHKITHISVQALINVPTEKVWKYWTTPTHITKWNNANDDWHTPHAENDLTVCGKFLYRMESKDGNDGFDFDGVYVTVKANELIEYILSDGRKVKIEFIKNGNKTNVIEIFEAETANSIEHQRQGWQAILNNFKKYAESDQG